MKASLITIHVGFNFGSILQTIASVEVLKGFGTDVEVVNYVPNRVRPKYFLSGANGFMRRIKRVLLYPNFLLNTRIYQNYLRKYCRLSSPIYNDDRFVDKCPKADIYITGSDQVWNSVHNEGVDKRYFFEGIGGRFISFSSSFGREVIPDAEAEYVKTALKRYSAVSVREESAVALLSSLGIRSEQLMDPTFLLDRFEWEGFMTDRRLKEPYVLVYAPYNIVDEVAIYNTARKIAAQRKCKVVTFSWDLFRNKYADITVKYASPGDFLMLMKNADFVITNSFHGTAFSINLNKQFAVFKPSSFFTRIESILSLCGLDGRVANDVISDEVLNTSIDYSKVNEILETEREKAKSFLSRNL